MKIVPITFADVPMNFIKLLTDANQPTATMPEHLTPQ